MEQTTTTKTAYQLMLEEAERRQDHAWHLREDGQTFEQIGLDLKVTPERARQIVNAAAKRRAKGGVSRET